MTVEVFTTKPIILSPTVYAKAEARIREAVNFVDEYEISSLKGLIGSIEIFGIEE